MESGVRRFFDVLRSGGSDRLTAYPQSHVPVLVLFSYEFAQTRHSVWACTHLQHRNERTGMSERYLLSIDETADALRIGRSKTYELIAEGRLDTVTIGRRRLVRIESVRAIASGEAA